MKRRAAGSLVLGSVMLSVTGCSGGTTGASKIYIGVAGPISGPQTVFGEVVLNAAQLAVAEINAKGGVLGKQVEVIPGDDQGDPRQAATVAQKMISTDGLVGVVGHFNSGCSIPASKIYNLSNVTMISPGSTNPKLTEQGFTNVFRLVGTDNQQGSLDAQFAIKELKAKTIAVMHDKTAYGQGLAESFQKSALAGGAKVASFDGIAQGDKDFRSVLTKINGLKPDTIFFGGVFTEAALIISQAREIGFTGSFMSGDGTQDQSFIEAVGTKSDKIYLSGVKTINSAKFISDYQAKYKTTPNAFGTYSYDATRVLLAAVAKAGSTDRVAVTKAMREIKDFPGLGGTINFNPQGDPVTAPFDIYIIRDKKFILYT